MITIRQLERFWQEKRYDRMFNLCQEMRPEASLRLAMELGRAVPAAAMAIIRLDELSQSHVPFCSQMLRVILAAQEADGGWGELMTTALCLRALMCSHGQGQAIDRALAYLANLQKTEGAWPKVPIRRLAADAYTSAFVLYQLADDARFQRAVRFNEALIWFGRNEVGLDFESGRLWHAISLGHRPSPAAVPATAA